MATSIDPDRLQADGYIRLLQQLMFSEATDCKQRLQGHNLRYEFDWGPDPNTLPRDHFDMEIDLWVFRDDAGRARELIRDVPSWTGNGCLGDRMKS